MLNQLNAYLEQGYLPESQYSFKRGEELIDMIFTACQLQEKCQEQNRQLYMATVNITKAFDAISQEGLWKIMAKCGFPSIFIMMVRQFYNGSLLKYSDNDGDCSDVFPVSNGGKQGCMLVPTLFSMVFSACFQNTNQRSHQVQNR